MNHFQHCLFLYLWLPVVELCVDPLEVAPGFEVVGPVDALPPALLRQARAQVPVGPGHHRGGGAAGADVVHHEVVLHL